MVVRDIDPKMNRPDNEDSSDKKKPLINSWLQKDDEVAEWARNVPNEATKIKEIKKTQVKLVVGGQDNEIPESMSKPVKVKKRPAGGLHESKEIEDSQSKVTNITNIIYNFNLTP